MLDELNQVGIHVQRVLVQAGLLNHGLAPPPRCAKVREEAVPNSVIGGEDADLSDGPITRVSPVHVPKGVKPRGWMPMECV